MTHRSRALLLLLAVAAVLAVSPAVASAGAGFTVPSGNTTCGILTTKQAYGRGAGLYCTSSYIKAKPAEAIGAVKLNRTGRARKISMGNDEALPVSGLREDGGYDKRPVLAYGKTWRRGGFKCVSRSTGLLCSRSKHGFFLSREEQDYF
ncbi:hypothetical protein DVA67_011430 [Solirubrobacter sp. CPCC 204708]|uniref:Uncharacterized protein n=1 Tax=Solirubrobacter deserti TaxID=2282478 RepID=A0ABT4RHY4_9ACTN|nr:DUF6636 domain-containing protein [Solirubrobacter deserti]MBE2316590.1 hypothetical protein [Solirubrobacter deserti]MDA0138122.1 hypothetical protein [Solirubrobacter deserti]